MHKIEFILNFISNLYSQISICANDIFIAIYGVIFTIVISLGIYIYGLQDKEEKITLLKSTNIKGITRSCFLFFVLSFFVLPSPIYEVINSLFIGWILLILLKAFEEVFRFNESELSGQRAIRKFKKGVIHEKLNQFDDLKKKNDLLNKEFKKLKEEGKEVGRFLLNEDHDFYDLVYAQDSGYITNIKLNIIGNTKNTSIESINIKNQLNFRGETKDSFERPKVYIPYYIAYGAPINSGTVILGVEKKEDLNIDENRLRSFISISDDYENPTSYIEAETRSYYPEMISLIQIGDVKSLELKLKEFSGFVDYFITKADSYASIIQFINEDTIFALQKYAFKQGNVDCIREVVSFFLSYVSRAIDKKSAKVFNIFFRNLNHAFYESFNLGEKERDKFLDIYFEWLSDIATYSLKSRFQEEKDYLELVITLLSGVNEWLKAAFDRKDIDVFNKTLNLLNNSFSCESSKFGTNDLLNEVVILKKAVIFGFTAWVYKDFSEKKDDDFYRKALEQLLSVFEKDRFEHYADSQDGSYYYSKIYSKSLKLSERKEAFRWGSWDMPEGEIHATTARRDMKNLFMDRILNLFIPDKDKSISSAAIDIKKKGHYKKLAFAEREKQPIDILFNKTKDSFISTEKLTDKQFEIAKEEFYKVFPVISEKDESSIKNKLIKQPIDDDKFAEFVKQNLESYKRCRVLHRIHKFKKGIARKSDVFGYNILLPKEQFVKDTDVLYANDDQFGENMARFEDNKILEAIYLQNTPSIGRERIKQPINRNVRAIVFWLNGYLNLEAFFSNNFSLHLQDTDLRRENNPYYQGKVKGIPVFIVHGFIDQKSYRDSMFVFKRDPFSVHEFEIKKDVKLDEKNTKWFDDKEACLALSVTNLSNLDDKRREIVEDWINENPERVKDKDGKIKELKTNVILEFYKGLSVDNIDINLGKVNIFHVDEFTM